jgi:hypothetical protein
MNFTVPRYADVGDIVDRALTENARDIPLSLRNLMPRLRWRLAGLEISEPKLTETVRERAHELDVALID